MTDDDDEISEEDRKISDEVLRRIAAIDEVLDEYGIILTEDERIVFHDNLPHFLRSAEIVLYELVQKTGAYRRFRELPEDTSYLQQLFETLVRNDLLYMASEAPRKYVKTNLGVEVFDRLRAIYPLENSH